MSSYAVEVTFTGKNEATSAIESVKSGLRSVGEAATQSQGGVGGFFSNMLSTAGGFLSANVIGGITSQFGNLASGMISGNAQFETYQTQFGVLLGGADAAKQRLSDLAAFGASTPFELPQVVEADKILQGFGLHSEESAKKFGYSGEQIRTIAGDVASGTGAGFNEMSLLLGKFSAGATGEAISRMAELGITSRDELSKMGLEFNKSGELLSPLPESMNVVLGLMKTKFGGMMDAQSQTFDGMMSNVQDWVGGTLRTLGQPIFEVLREKLQGVLVFLGSPEVTGGITAFATALTVGIGTAITFITTSVIPAFIRGWQSIQPVIALVATFITATLIPAVLAIIPVVQANIQPILAGLAAALIMVVVPAFVSWAVAAGAAAIATMTALAPVVLPILAIGVAVGVLYAAWNSNFGGIRTTIEGFWNSTGQPIFQQLQTWLATTLTAALQSLASFWIGTLQPALMTVWTFISGTLIPLLGATLVATFVLVQGGLTALAGFWTGTLQPALNAVYTFTTTYVIPILNAVADVMNAVVGLALRTLAGYWTGTLQPALNTVWSFIQGSVIPVLNTLAGSALKDVQDKASSVASFWTSTLQPAFSAVGSIISSTVKPALDGISGVLGGIASGFNGIGSAISGAVGWLERLASAIRSLPSIPSLPGGGSIPGFASGTSYAPGGMALVGENGPEFVNLPRGSQVFTNRQSGQMVGGATTIFNLTANYSNQDERALADDIRTLRMLYG